MNYKIIARYPTDETKLASWRRKGKPGTQFKKWTYLTVADLKRYRGDVGDYRNIEEYDLSLHILHEGEWSLLYEGAIEGLVECIGSL